MAGVIAARLRGVPAALWLVLGIGLALRIAVALTVRPAALTLHDSALYVDGASGELFSDRTRPAGYAAILRVLHAISRDIDLTIAVQHATGLATACLVFACARRLAVGPVLAAVCALPVACNLDAIFFEHAVMAEPFFTAALVAACYAAIRALTGDAPVRWLAGAGVALGVAAVTRSILLPVLALVVVWAAAAMPRARLRSAAALGAGALAVLLTYATANATQTGRFSVTPTGAGLYNRVAQIADCREFTPPSGTAALCESIPPSARYGPDYYAWEAASPAVKLFGPTPSDERLTRFAIATIVHQPLDYLRMGIADVVRYFVPGMQPRPFGGVGMVVADLDRRAPATEVIVSRALDRYYAPERARVRESVDALAAVQRVLRVTPLVLSVLTALALVALVAGGGAVRRFSALVLVLSLGQLMVSAFGAVYSQRYALPPAIVLSIAAVTGAPLAVRRFAGPRAPIGQAA